jgi:hypothetical protein
LRAVAGGNVAVNSIVTQVCFPSYEPLDGHFAFGTVVIVLLERTPVLAPYIYMYVCMDVCVCVCVCVCVFVCIYI